MSGDDLFRVEDGEVLDGFERRGKAAEPAAREGIGLLLEGKRDLVIRAAAISGFRRNLVLRGCRNVVVEGGEFSESHQPVLYSTDAYDERDWLDIFDETVWRTYGAGIVLEDCEGCVVRGVRASGAQNGLMLIDSRGCTVTGCDFSRNSGWGLWMWRSSDNTIARNNCDWCVRCEDPERYSAGGDSAGIMLSNGNCRNVIAHNSFRFSGDGFFLNGLRVAPSEYNVVAYNDGSHSPHNAFESSFSGHNTFIGNNASNSRFGFWCGYSHHNELLGNVADHCLEWGIAIEHGYQTRLLGNRIRGVRRGVVLWRREPGQISEECPDQPSRDYVLDGNLIQASEAAVTLSGTTGVRIRDCDLEGAPALELKRGSTEVRVEGGNLRGEVAVHAEADCEAALEGCYAPGERVGPVTACDLAAEEAHPSALPLAESVAPPEVADPEFRWFDRRRQQGTLVGNARV